MKVTDTFAAAAGIGVSSRTNYDNRLERAISLIIEELAKATAANGAFASAHEGYAIMLEEMDELKGEVWKNNRKRDYGAMRSEAIQVAAMAIRFLVDIAIPEVSR